MLPSQQCQFSLFNTPDTYYFSKTNATDIWPTVNMDQNACFAGTKLFKNVGNLYVYAPDVILQGNSSSNYLFSNSIFIRKDIIGFLEPGSIT